MNDAVVFAVTLASLYAAHSVADHWIQTHKQACDKAEPGRFGRLANLRHVASHTLTLAVVLAFLAWRFDLGYNPAAVAAGLAINALTHAWADRRHTLRRLAYALGKAGYWDLPDGSGRYALDQSWHLGWLFVSALVISI